MSPTWCRPGYERGRWRASSGRRCALADEDELEHLVEDELLVETLMGWDGDPCQFTECPCGRFRDGPELLCLECREGRHEDGETGEVRYE
jgi:hypothetical protein